MCLKFAFLVCAAVFTLWCVSSAESDDIPKLYNSNNDINIKAHDINSYSDKIQQPANSYNYKAYKNNAQQQQPPVNGYDYKSNNLQKPLQNNFNSSTPQQQEQRQPTLPTPSHEYTYTSGAQAPLNNAAPTHTAHAYNPKNVAALSASSSAGGFVGTATNIETSYSSQARQSLAPAFATIEDHYPPAKYNYSYSVVDDSTGDIKSHAEARDGYSVQGSYSVVDPDGYQRIVKYTVDGASGFHAIVNRVPYALNSAVAAESLQSTWDAPIAKLAEQSPSNNVASEVSASST